MAPLTLPGKGVIVLLIALATILSACVSFGIYNPTDNAVFDGSMAPADIRCTPSMSGLKVSLDGIDITSSLQKTGDCEYQSTAAGLPISGSFSAQHVLAAEAD